MEAIAQEEIKWCDAEGRDWPTTKVPQMQTRDAGPSTPIFSRVWVSLTLWYNCKGQKIRNTLYVIVRKEKKIFKFWDGLCSV